MRYSIPDPFDQETGGEPAPPPAPAPDPPTTIAEPPAVVEPAVVAAPVDAPVDVPVEAAPADDPAEPIEPPLWNTADDHVLHLPPQAVGRVSLPWRRRRWAQQWPFLRRRFLRQGQGFAPAPGFFPGARVFGQRPPVFAPRPSVFGARPPFVGARQPFFGQRPPAFAPRPTIPRDHRRGTINAVGRLVRAAKRVGTWRNRTGGQPLPVFRSRVGGRPFRIVTKPRGGMRHEILAIEPELETMENEFEAVAPGTTAPTSVPVYFGVDSAAVDGDRNPNWVRAKKEGPIGFAIIRSNFGTAPDTVFKREWPRIKEAGLIRGAYLFLLYGKGKQFDPVAQAKAMIKTVGPLEPGDLPPTIDVEFSGGRAKTGLTAQQCLDATRAAWKVLKDHYGVAPIIYTSARVWREDLNDLPAPDLVESPLWLARYPYKKGPVQRNPKAFAGGRLDPPVPPPWGALNWWIHQYQGDATGLPGLRQVDMNRFNTMTFGASGARVKWVQRRLGAAETGTFDAATATALRALKRQKGLPVNDVIDPRTFALLCWLQPVRQAGTSGELDELWNEIAQEGESDSESEGAWAESEFEDENQLGAGKPSAVQARILWPALGFPAVIARADRPSGNAMRDGDATTCICVLVVSNKSGLTPEDAARYLRCVPWEQRGKRHIQARQFAASEISVRNDAGNALAVAGRKDGFGEHVRFGANGNKLNGISGCLASSVRTLYKNAGLPHLYEIRVSEAATAKLQGDQYHLFWNNERPGDTALSDEMQLLVTHYARPQRARLGRLPDKEMSFLIQEYTSEYGGLHAPYNRNQGSQQATPSEILHPLFIRRRRDKPLSIGHVTDTHVDVRADVYDQNIRAARVRGLIPKNKGDYNNFNESFKKVYGDAKEKSDILLLTGDLIDYGRGHWGLERPKDLQVDAAYHVDRNWFLFYYLLASGKLYSTPSYTILGNHDWRLNPYPPFAPGAPKPNELLNDHLQLKPAEQKSIIEHAHGDGHKRGFSYTAKAETTWQLVKEQTGGALKALVQLFGQTSNLEQAGFPTETKIDSIAWYLLSINPFLDYSFTLPTRQSVLMLDWAKDEDVLFPRVLNGEKSGYNPLSPGDAAGTPRPRSSLTTLQQKLIADFVSGPSRAKVIGVHAPPISPYWDWYDIDLFRARKTYANPDTARGPKGGHPLFAVTPSKHVTTPFGMVADRGSLGKNDERDWFIRLLNDSRYSVRMVFSGHVHRNGVYVVHAPPKPIEIVNPKSGIPLRIANPLIVGGLHAQSAGGPAPFVTTNRTKKGPLYITTTSAGPRGSFEKRGPTAQEAAVGGTTTDPGYSQVVLAGDGTIGGVKFVWGQAPAEKMATPVPRQREVSIGMP